LYHPVDASHALEVVFCEVLEANFLEKVVLPALDTAVDTDRDKALLADDTAEAAGLTTSGNVCEGVGQIVELAPVEELLGHVVLEPKNLWNLHFNAHFTTDITKEVVVGGIDLVRLLLGTVVKPENDIAVVSVGIVKLGASDGDGLVGVIGEDGQRAGRIEADTADCVWIDVVLVEGTLGRLADAVPDVGGGLFLVIVSVWMRD